jgi:glutathione S-transferase
MTSFTSTIRAFRKGQLSCPPRQRFFHTSTLSRTNMSKDQKNYHTAPTGAALETANSHSSPAPYTLFGACFCPFVQRVWILLEHAKVPYQYREVDPYKKPQDLLEVSPKGLVPGLKINDGSNGGKGKAVAESTVIMEYIEDLAEVQKLEGKFEGKTTLPELKNTCESGRYLVHL